MNQTTRLAFLILAAYARTVAVSLRIRRACCIGMPLRHHAEGSAEALGQLVRSLLVAGNEQDRRLMRLYVLREFRNTLAALRQRPENV